MSYILNKKPQMGDQLTITFPNKPHKYKIPLEVLSQYPLSPFHGYHSLLKTKKIECDMSRSEFEKMHNAVINKTKYKELDNKTKKSLHHYGLTHDAFFEAEKFWKNKMDKDTDMIDIIVSSKNEFIRIGDQDTYKRYVEFFKYTKNIVPVQMIGGKQWATWISILNGLPIFRDQCTIVKKQIGRYWLKSQIGWIDSSNIKKKLFDPYINTNILPLYNDIKTQLESDDPIEYFNGIIDLNNNFPNGLKYAVLHTKSNMVYLDYDQKAINAIVQIGYKAMISHYNPNGNNILVFGFINLLS